MNSKSIGLGLYSLSGVYGKKDVSKIKEMLTYAVNQGVDYFDTADAYGNAEMILGDTLKEWRSDIQFATKVGVKENGIFDCSYEYIQEACKKSLKNLRTDYIDLYQIHFDDSNTPVEETIQALEDLKRKGLIRAYGVGHSPIKKVEEYVRFGKPETIMIELNPLNITQYQKINSLYKKHNLKIITMCTTGRGILTGKIKKGHKFSQHDIRSIDPQFQRGLLDSAYRILNKIEDIARIYNRTPVQVAINWVISQEGIFKALVGPSTKEHLKENLGAYEFQIEKEHMKELNDIIEKENMMRKSIIENDIYEILNTDLSDDKNKIVADLIYVLDGLVETGKMEQKNAMPLFSDLLAWRSNKEFTKEIPERIRDELKQYCK